MQKQNVDYCKQYPNKTQRLKQSKKLLDAYPDRVPIIVQPLPGSTVPWLQNTKFLILKTSTCSMLQARIRLAMHMHAEYALQYLVDCDMPGATIEPIDTEYAIQDKQAQHITRMLNGAELVGNVYTQCAKKDGFCYVYYDQEHFFG